MELRDVPISEPTLSPANAGSTRYAVKQMFPLGDKRGLRRGVAEAELSAAEARRSATTGGTADEGEDRVQPVLVRDAGRIASPKACAA